MDILFTFASAAMLLQAAGRLASALPECRRLWRAGRHGLVTLILIPRLAVVIARVIELLRMLG